MTIGEFLTQYAGAFFGFLGAALAAGLPMAIGGLLSGIAQGRVAAASVNIVAKNPNDWSKGMVLCIIVEFYAILSLLISFLMIMFGF